jgi:hypothetical protein
LWGISDIDDTIAPKLANVLVSPRDAATLAELPDDRCPPDQPRCRPIQARLRGYTGGCGEACEGDLTALASNLNFGHIIDLIKG